jgi:hypothetical protein
MLQNVALQEQAMKVKGDKAIPFSLLNIVP